MLIAGRELLLPTTMVGNYPNPSWYIDQPWAVFPDAAGAAAVRARPGHSAAADPTAPPREAFQDAVAAIVHDQQNAGLDVIADGRVYGGSSAYGQILYHEHFCSGPLDCLLVGETVTGCVREAHEANVATQNYFAGVPAAALMNVKPFGTPHPVTLSHPGVTVSDESVPKLNSAESSESYTQFAVRKLFWLYVSPLNRS